MSMEWRMMNMISERKMQESTETVEAEQKFRRLWLVRHGSTLWNSEQRFCGHSDIPLSSEGRAQARWLARRLRTQPITTLYRSDLLRSQQTAEIIAAQLPYLAQIEISSAWREIAFGVWEGLTYEQIVQKFPSNLNFFTDPVAASPPGGESLTTLAQRVQDAFIKLAHAPSDSSARDGDIVLVSHGGPLRILLCMILSMPLEQQWRLRLAPGSLSAIDFLPVIDDTVPVATLALFNEQRVVR
jgi:broad specificity phosphatase PhoE